MTHDDVRPVAHCGRQSSAKNCTSDQIFLKPSAQRIGGLPRWVRALALLARLSGAFSLAMLGQAATAQVDTKRDTKRDTTLQVMPVSVTLSFEQTRLPGGERMGLVGTSLLFEASPGWWVGPAVYGASSGERAGFFVGGIEVQRRWRLSSQLQAVTGFYAGGGGGGGAPVGGGLMLRPAASLLWGLGGWQAGLSLADTRFPDGGIRRSPWGLVLAWDGAYRYSRAEAIGQPMADMRSTGLGFDQVQGLMSAYPLQDGTRRSVVLPGARLLKRNGPWGLSIESSAAASGGAAGYMEVLGGVSAHQALGSGLEAGVRAAVGLGGGGAMAKGGGGLTKLSAFLAWGPAPGWQLGLEAGPVRGAGGAPKAQALQVWLGMDLEPRSGAPGGAVPGRVAGYEWVAGVQQIRRGVGKNGSSAPIELVSGKLERHLDSGIYLSAQAHSAFGGDAGAFSMGMLGAGLATPSQMGSWRFGAELLAGAAGGGGVQTGGGGLVQGLAWAGYSVGPASQVRWGLGAVRALSGGGLSSPVVELSFSHRFGLGSW